MILFEIYFSDGRVSSFVANNPLEAFIKAANSAILQDLSLEISTVINEETGKIYEIRLEIQEVENDK